MKDCSRDLVPWAGPLRSRWYPSTNFPSDVIELCAATTSHFQRRVTNRHMQPIATSTSR